MSDPGSPPREWPPRDLLAALSLKTTAEAELQLDENVLSGKFLKCREQLLRLVSQVCPGQSLALSLSQSAWSYVLPPHLDHLADFQSIYRASTGYSSSRNNAIRSKCLGADRPYSNLSNRRINQGLLQKGIGHVNKRDMD